MADTEDRGRTQGGGCLCGALRFETQGPLRAVIFCHCEECRRNSGLYFGCTSVPDEHLVLVSSNSLRWFRSSEAVRRGFCGTCGTPIFWKDETRETTSILAGSFDQPTGLGASCHIFTGEKADFYELPNDGLPRFAADRPKSLL